MAKRSVRTTRKSKRTVATPYYSASLIGAKITDTIDDVVTKNTPIETVPTIVFYDSGSKVYIDYSHASGKDLQSIKSFFKGFTTGTSFSIEDGTASFLKERKNKIEADLSGSFTFISYKNNLITANVTSVTGKESFTDTYESKYFTTTPRLSKSTDNATGDYAYQIRNHSGIDSVYSFKNARPIVPGDLVELSTPLNKGRFPVEGYHVEDGVEVLTVSGRLKEEDLMGTLITVKFYRTFNETSVSAEDKQTLRAIRQNGKEPLRGSCCLYTKEIKEDKETGHVFEVGDLYSCGCKYDWECIQLARKTNSFLNFNRNSKYCEDTYNDECCGESVFANSPDEDSLKRCKCCTQIRSTDERFRFDEGETETGSGASVSSRTIAISQEERDFIRDRETSTYDPPSSTFPVSDPVSELQISYGSSSAASRVTRKTSNAFFDKNLNSVIQVRFDGRQAQLGGVTDIYSGRVYRFDQSHPSNAGKRITFSESDKIEASFESGIIVSKNGVPGEIGSYTDLILTGNFTKTKLFLISVLEDFDSAALTVLGYSPLTQKTIFEATRSVPKPEEPVATESIDFNSAEKESTGVTDEEPTVFNISVKRIEED